MDKTKFYGRNSSVIDRMNTAGAGAVGGEAGSVSVCGGAVCVADKAEQIREYGSRFNCV